jgi:DNA adenine methylase
MQLPAPILKWAGGKRQLLGEILRRIPPKIETYFEPFFGGGAVFFALASRNVFRDAVIGDTNAELVNLYRVVRDSVDQLIPVLRSIGGNSEKDYYAVRGACPTHPVERAARMVYLNKTGFNGLYRVNKNGVFNVPFGAHKNPTICNEEALRSVSRALENTLILHNDFDVMLGAMTRGDFAYLDPPYLPLSDTSNFDTYQPGGFGVSETERLAWECSKLRHRGSHFLLSSSDTPDARRIFGNFHVETVQAKRSINSKGSGRGVVSELLVSG